MSGRRSYAGVLTTVLFVAMGIGLAMLPSGSTDLERSVLSAKPEGRRALFLLLGELGIPARVWTETPSELPRGEGLLWLPAAPSLPPGIDELSRMDGMPPGTESALARHDPAHYRRFLDEGGTILCALASPGMPEFVSDALEVDVPGPDGILARSGGTHLVLAPSGERLAAPGLQAFSPDAWKDRPEAVIEGFLSIPQVEFAEHVEPIPAGPDGEAARERAARAAEARAGKELPALVRVPVGRGSLLLLASDDAFANQRLREGDHALLAARLVERFAGGAPVLFDEYALGRWSPGSPVSMATAPDRLPLSLHVLLVLALFAWSRGWARAFPRDPVPPEPLSALARVRSRAGLFLRAGRPDLLALLLRDGLLAELHRRGLRGRLAPPGDLDATVAGLLGPGAAPEEVEQWVERLRVSEVASSRDLESFQRELDAFAQRIRPGRVQASATEGIM